jgi:phage terminase large subunit-like protein
MCDFAADGLANGKSPDRLDALVWALTELLLTSTRIPIIHRM